MWYLLINGSIENQRNLLILKYQSFATDIAYDDLPMFEMTDEEYDWNS